MEDLTIPDRTAFPPGAQIEKIWLVANSGTCNWDGAFSIRHVSGPILGAEPNQGLFPARSGSEAQVRILFIAPAAPGEYQSSWQAYSPSGDAFGDLLFTIIQVDLGLSPEETPDADDGTTE